MRLQIAFEYLIVFVFVLLVFTILLSSIVKQLAQFSSEQLFAQLQIVAQTVSSEIAIAGHAGSGYSASFLLPSELSVLEYNISITKSGTVIASSSVSGQRVVAVASGGDFIIYSNSSFFDPTNTYYIIPTYNGSGSITLQNSLGIICVDYQCPVPSNQVAQLSVSSQSWHALFLNGQNSYAQAPNIASLSQPSTVTMSGWMYINGPSPGCWNWLVAERTNYGVATCGANNNVCYYNWNAAGPGGACGGGGEYDSPATLTDHTWYLLTAVVNGGSETVYVDGNEVLTGALNPSGSQDLNAFGIGFGGDSSGQYFNGLITNVQIYSSAMVLTQIQQLYHEGITGAPIQSADPLAWWPLNGNGNDYSGNYSDLLFFGQSSFPSVVQINSQVYNATAGTVMGALVGVSSSSGNFIEGPSTYNLTNSSGVASVILNQGQNSGTALVKGTAFNGNSSFTGNVVAWWPLNEGQGKKIYDISPQSNGPTYLYGNILGGAWWAYPNYIATFDGKSSYLEIPGSASASAFNFDITNGETITGWVNLAGPSADQFSWLIFKESGTTIGFCGSALLMCYIDPSTGLEEPSHTTLTTGTWYMVSHTVGAVSSGFLPGGYINGFRVESNILTPESFATDFEIGGTNTPIGSSTNSQFLNGSVSNLQIYSEELTQAELADLYKEGVGGPPLQSQNLAAWWPFDGDTLDYSGNGYNGTTYGNLQMTHYTATQYQSSSFLAAYFNGASSYIKSSNTVGFNVPSNMISVSGWVEFQGSNAAGLNWLFSRSGDFSVGACTNLLNVCYYNWGTGTAVDALNANLAPNTWYMFTGVYNGTSNTETVYVDGANVLTGPATFGAGAAASNFLIGYSGVAGDFLSGYASNIQYYATDLSQKQVLALYSQGISGAPLSGAGLISWFPLNGDSKDYANIYDTGAFTNNAYYSQTVNPPYLTPSISGYGLYFNGAGSAVVNNPVTVTTPTAITVSAWAYPVSSFPSGDQSIVGQTSKYELTLNNNGNEEADFKVCIGSGFTGVLADPSGLSLNSWYMITGVYNGTYLDLYVNGVLVNKAAHLGSLCSSTMATVIGASPASPYTSNGFNGTIADVQVYNAALNQVQVGQLYNSGLPLSQSVSVPLGGIS